MKPEVVIGVADYREIPSTSFQLEFLALDDDPQVITDAIRDYQTGSRSFVLDVFHEPLSIPELKSQGNHNMANSVTTLSAGITVILLTRDCQSPKIQADHKYGSNYPCAIIPPRKGFNAQEFRKTLWWRPHKKDG